MARSGKRSPIERPSRQAGESLERQLNEKHGFVWMYAAGVAIALIGAALVAWMYHLRGRGDAHLVLTAAAVVATAATAILIGRGYGRALNLAKGAAGERGVADVLDDLRPKGYRVLHDLPIVRDGKTVANIDHVLIGPAGIFALETKYISKPERPPSGRAEIHWGGEGGNQLLACGMPLDRDPIRQARAAARDLNRILKDRTGRDLPVRPVVLFPGWWVNTRSCLDTWVLSPKLLGYWLDQEARARRPAEASFGPEEAEKFATSLLNHCRETPHG